MAESDRGIHPDLVDEQPEAQATPAPEAPRRGRRSAAPPPPPAAEPEAEAPATDATPESAEEPVDWQQAWSTASSPEEAFKLLAKNLPREQLEKDETLSGLIGSRADVRARDLIRQQEREAI